MSDTGSTPVRSACFMTRSISRRKRSQHLTSQLQRWNMPHQLGSERPIMRISPATWRLCQCAGHPTKDGPPLRHPRASIGNHQVIAAVSSRSIFEEPLWRRCITNFLLER